MEYINIIMFLLLGTLIIFLWVFLLYQLDETIFKGHFVKKMRASVGVEE